MALVDIILLGFAVARLSRLLVSERGFLAVAANVRALFIRQQKWDGSQGEFTDYIPRKFLGGEIGKMLMCELCTQVVLAGLAVLSIALARRLDAPFAFVLWLAVAQMAGIARKFS